MIFTPIPVAIAVGMDVDEQLSTAIAIPDHLKKLVTPVGVKRPTNSASFPVREAVSEPVPGKKRPRAVRRSTPLMTPATVAGDRDRDRDRDRERSISSTPMSQRVSSLKSLLMDDGMEEEVEEAAPKKVGRGPRAHGRGVLVEDGDGGSVKGKDKVKESARKVTSSHGGWKVGSGGASSSSRKARKSVGVSVWAEDEESSEEEGEGVEEFEEPEVRRSGSPDAVEVKMETMHVTSDGEDVMGGASGSGSGLGNGWKEDDEGIIILD
ncbi:hypothetical protein HK097_010111 [Rhizophlyctis rosea]|uniref:Uncharacterized protein n=1 Tax=Rhizophlyctis rosea TaxID=64517 RepID=A0AAD5S9N5_9FUNG|nr:hypothetical protein HK097_010111 [Rhizophlyctis rosea]